LKKGIQKKLNINKVPFILVALDGGDWVGTASLWEHDLDKRPDLTPWIAGVYVKENYRGQGIASQLINRVFDIAKKFGFKKIYLHTEHTHRLYEKLGWSRLEESINDQGEPTTVYVLEI
jgi:GNAT superfamily N-acetyltransferase